MNTAQMPRKNAGYRLDDRCIDALKVLAKKTGVSVNEYLEKLLFEHAKVHGVIPSSDDRLGETRGRKKPKESTDEQPIGTDLLPETAAGKRSGPGRKAKAVDGAIKDSDGEQQ
jgi:hypothetical protein